MKLDYITDGVIKHKKAGSLLDCVGGSVDIDEVENWSQDLVHTLNVLYFGVEFGVNVEDPRHIVVAVGPSLLLLVLQELLIVLLLLSVDQLEFLPPRIREVRNQDVFALAGEKRKLRVGPRSVLLDLFPQQIVIF